MGLTTGAYTIEIAAQNGHVDRVFVKEMIPGSALKSRFDHKQLESET